MGQAKKARASAKVRQALQRYTDLAIRIRSRVRAARNQAHALRNQARYYQNQLLPLRQRIVDGTQQQYNAMQIGVFQLLQAKRRQITTARQYVQTLRDYWIARTDLHLMLAGHLPEHGAAPAASAGMPAMEAGGGDEH
jgi:cobalt-zinc-cadmium efflux system outer membrane protein